MVTEVPKNEHPVNFYTNLYQSYKRRNKRNIARENKNWGFYSGVDYKQWNDAQLQVLIDEKRAPHQVNFIQKNINSLAGNFYQNEFEADFEPNTGTSNDDTLLLKNLYLTDVNRGGWAKARRKLIRAGLIYRGTIEMFVDYKTDPRGSISIRYVNHNRMLYDPDWTTDEICDNKHIIQYAWMDPQQIKQVYRTKSSEIDEAIRLWEQSISTRGDDQLTPEEKDRANTYYDNDDYLNIIDGRFLVIQVSRLERGISSQLLDKETGERLPEMSEANVESMVALRGSTLRVVEDQYAKLRVTTIAPGLSKTLLLANDEMHKMQTGNYQYKAWSSLNINGEVQGPVDVLKDLQEMYNKRESTYTHWQTTSANGAEFVEEDFFATSAEKDKYIDSKNKPGGTFIVGSGKLSQSRMGIAIRPRGDAPTDLHISADRAYNMVSEVGYNVPAISGGEGKSGESAKLFQEKRAQALVALEPITKSLQEFEEELGESYFYMTKPVYGNAPRVMADFKTKKPLFLNIPTANGEILNEVNKIRRHTIIIKTSRNGESVRRELLDRYQEVLTVVKNPIMLSLIERDMINYLPNIPESELDELKDSADAFVALQKSRSLVEITQNQFGIAQFKQQTEALNAPPGQGGLGGGPPGPNAPGKTPGEGGGISVEGSQTAAGAGVPVDLNNANQLK